jgi:DNA-binding transcriptional LysR family regulator
MELRQLRHFAALVSHGNFTRAAKSFNLTQPALSRQIKCMEDELGVALLIRESNKVSLTPSGRIFFEEVKEILHSVDHAIQRVQINGRSKPIRVGYMQGVVAGFLPCVLNRFQKSHDGVMPELVDLMPGELVTRARAGKLDAIIMPKGSEIELPAFQWKQVKLLERGLVMPKKHPWAELSRIPPKRLSGQTLHGFVPSKYPAYATIVKDSLERFNVKPVMANKTADDLNSLFSALEADFGLALLSENVIPILPAGLVYRPFYPRLVPLPLLVGIREVQPGVQAEEFAALVAQAAAEKNLKWR